MRPPRLAEEEISQHLARLPGWTRRGEALTRQYTFPGFSQAMGFVNTVAEAAEAVQHHPEIDIRYRHVTLTFSTHDAGGLTTLDFASAAAADELAEPPQN